MIENLHKLSHDPPRPQGVPALVMEQQYNALAMSIGGFEAEPDEDPWWDWCSDNCNEAPFAWRDRRPTF